MKKFLSLLKKLSERPGMYLGRARMKLVRAWYSGYLDAFEHSNPKNKKDLDIFYCFPEWVYWKYKIDASDWGWERVLAHKAGSDEKAVLKLYETFQAYLRDVKTGKFDSKNLTKSFTGRYPERSFTEGWYDK